MRNDLRTLGTARGRESIPDEWSPDDGKDNLDDLLELDELTKYEEFEGRKLELQDAITGLTVERSALKLDMSRAIADKQSGGHGKPFAWRSVRAVRLEEIKGYLLAINHALAALKVKRVALGAEKRDMHVAKPRLGRVSMHFVAICEHEMSPERFGEVWTCALELEARREPIRSERLGFLAEAGE